MKLVRLLVACTFVTAAMVHAQNAPDPNAIRVQLLSGKTGRPILSKHVFVADEHNGNRQELATDGEGYITLSPRGPVIKVWVEQFRPCSKTGKLDFPTTAIRVTGVVSENICKPRITLYHQPGTLHLFLRPETLLERMKH